MDYAGIKAVLDEHPDMAALDDGAAAAAINALTETVYTPLGSDWLLEWALVRGVYQRVKGYIANEATPDALRLTLEGILILLERDNTTLRLKKPEIQGMLVQMQGAGVLTQEDVDSLYAQGSGTAPVWQRFGRPIEAEDIRLARLG